MKNQTRKSASPAGRYFKYAIGEIILVVIGILIALQINNWNENRNKRTHNQVVLTNLVTEFTSNSAALDSSIVRLTEVINALDSLLVLMNTTKPNINQDNFEKLLENTFVTPSWTPSSYVLEEMKSSGDLSDIENNKLKQVLFQWEREYSAMETKEEGYDQYAEEYIEFLTKYGSVRNLDAISGNIVNLKKSIIGQNELSLLSSLEFENRADNFYFLAYTLRNTYTELQLLMSRIIELAIAETND